MDFGFSPEQEMLRETARRFLAEESPSAFVRKMMDNTVGITPELWRKMAELGWLGLIYPEEYGGAGGSFVDLTVILEEMGRVVFPGPYSSTLLLGGLAILEGGDGTQKKAWLPRIATGEARVTLAWTEPNGRWDAEGITLTARRDGDAFVLTGTKLFVPDAHTADALVVAARTGSGPEAGVSLFLLPRESPGVTVTLLPTMDHTRKLCEVTFSVTRVPADALLGEAGRGWRILQRVIDRATVGLCAEMCGGTQRVLEMCTDYAKVRQAFGRPIGAYQAVKHKCADMLLLTENAKSITYYAAWAVSEDVPEDSLAASMAKAYTSDAYRKVAQDGIQIHGGIGFTWDHDLHLYFKRAKSSEVTFGDATFHRERVAQLIAL